MTNFSFDLAGVQRIVREIRKSENTPLTRHALRAPPQSFSNNQWPCPCFNSDSSDAPPYALLAVKDMTTLTDDLRPIVEIEQPGSTFRRVFAVAGPEGIKKQDYGRCSFGPFIPLAGDGTVSSLGPKSGQWTGEPNYPECFVPIGSGSDAAAWGVLKPIDSILFKTGSSFAKNTSAGQSIYAGPVGSEVDTGWTVSVRNAFGDLDSGKFGIAIYVNGIGYAVAAEC